jgi:uracil-DNA glycosylase
MSGKGNGDMVDRLEQWDDLEKRIVACQRCPRLVSWREQVARERRRAYRDTPYWGKPVPGFGDYHGRVLVVGLAPGAHGANRTGRLFTGDSSGIFLYGALHRADFANQPEASHRGDGLRLNDVFITAVCRCVPPANKPSPDEVTNCLPFLEDEMKLLDNLQVIVALGGIAFTNYLRLLRQQGYIVGRHKFGHGEVYRIGEGLPWLVASYHPSQQNTQTGRLTSEMFDEIWVRANDLLVQT